MTDRVLAFKLIASCNLSEVEHNWVFKEINLNQQEGTVFQRTREAIRMCYNAKALKNINKDKTLVIHEMETDSEDRCY